MFKDRANISRIIDIMCQKGLLEKQQDSNGRKIYKLIVSEKGRKLKEEIHLTDIELRNNITKDISQQELLTTFATLEKMNKNIRDKVKLQI